MTHREFIEQLAEKWGVTQKVSPWEREQAAKCLSDFVAAQPMLAPDGATCAACESTSVVPAVYCLQCGFALPPRR